MLRSSLWVICALVFVLLVIHRMVTRTTIPLPETVTLYGFSAMEAVMNDSILPAFRQHWEDRTGQKVEIITTFAGSAAITHEILRKVSVDIAILSSELDAARIAERGLILRSPRKPPFKDGVFSRSPMVLLVRAGNPKHVGDFEDLGEAGIQLVQADPATSGGAEMAVLSVYASAFRTSADHRRAIQRVAAVWNNTVTIAPSARAARREFQRGAGDVLITYESEALEASRSGDVMIVRPRATLMTEHVACKIVKNVSDEERELVDALIEFLWSAEAQTSLVRHGFRSVDGERNENDPRFVTDLDVMTLEDLGGVRVVKEVIVDTLWKERIVSRPSPPTTDSVSGYRGTDSDP